MDLKLRWINYLKSNQKVDSGIYDPVLFTKYSEPHRKYHDLNHITSCLNSLDSVVPNNVQKDKIELAIWFHDAIYIPQNLDNEECSAKLLDGCCSGLESWTKEYLNEVSDMILLTKDAHKLSQYHSRILYKPIEFKYFLDIDISILGSDENTFNLYCQSIREEYNWVPEEIYKTKRSEILNNYLNMGNIFKTKEFFNKFEQQAKINLEKEIKILNG